MDISTVILFAIVLFLCGLALGVGIKMDKKHNNDTD